MAAVSVNKGTMTLGDFILVNQFMLQLFMPLGFLGFVYREIKGAMANIERLFGVPKRSRHCRLRPPTSSDCDRGRIRFADVGLPTRQVTRCSNSST